MPKMNEPNSRNSKIPAQNLESEVMSYNSQTNQTSSEKPKKRVRICLRCNANLTDKNKCDKCGLKFHDGFLLRCFKKLLGIRPK